MSLDCFTYSGTQIRNRLATNNIVHMERHAKKMIRRIITFAIPRFSENGRHIYYSPSRRFCTKPVGTRTAAEPDADRLAEQARMSQNMWDFLVPERNMGVTHPFFLVLLVLTVSLHFYNNHRDQEEDERLRKQRLRNKSLES